MTDNMLHLLNWAFGVGRWTLDVYFNDLRN